MAANCVRPHSPQQLLIRFGEHLAAPQVEDSLSSQALKTVHSRRCRSDGADSSHLPTYFFR